MIELIKDPKVFNYIILVLYALNATATRWGFARSWGDFAYWVSAFGITASVTWGFKHG